MKYAIFKDIVTVQGHGAVLLLQVGSTALCLGNSGQSTEGATLEIRLFAPMAEKRFTIKWRGLTSRALDAGESPANPSLFPAEVQPPAKVTRKSPRQ